MCVPYGAKIVPLFIKQIQRFANKHNLLCKKNSTFKQTQTDLQIQNSIWEKMQRYGQICIVCYNCETHLPFYDQMWLDFLTNACRQIFSHVFKQIFSQMRAGRFSHMCSNWFSHKCVQADFLTCVQTDFLTNACRQIFSHVFKLIFSQMQSKQQMALLVNLRKTPVYLFKE